MLIDRELVPLSKFNLIFLKKKKQILEENTVKKIIWKENA
jgi:hypothetical protein